ncbi:MAG TPA: SDR family NAD(P)-dependent oxidoreductase [Gaiellaceae bacterium]|nr:SDR family NAD(P)-dependent oxidoreductase [Gaiellaceae bacterium]
MRALVTGGRSGIGAAIVAALGDADVTVLDLADGHDVGEPATWHALAGSFDAAFLNAGVVTGEPDVAAMTDEQYHRIMRVNVDGVVLGVRELAARLMPDGGSIVATASLAGLTGSPLDPVYALTKHAVVGFVRSVAPQLEARGIRINALCPAFTDTPLVVEELRGALPAPLIDPAFVAEAALRALHDEETGRAWIVQLNRIEPFRYPGVPGPR